MKEDIDDLNLSQIGTDPEPERETQKGKSESTTDPEPEVFKPNEDKNCKDLESFKLKIVLKFHC